MSISDNIWAPDDQLMIRYKGILDLDGLYRVIYNWFDARKFEWHEPNYKDKHPTSGGEQEIKIFAFRNDTDFIRINYNLYIHAYELEPITVTKEEKKKHLEKGRFLITIQASFEYDYENRWEDTKFHAALRDFYIKNILLRKILTYGDKMEYEAHNLQETIKQWLDMQGKGNQFADMY